MRVSSTEKLPDYQIIGPRLRIHWDHKEVEREDESGEIVTSWECQESVVPVTASRSQIIEAVMATAYPTYGSEIAATLDSIGEHAAMRRLAKRLADGRESGIVPPEPVPEKIEALQGMLAIEQSGMAGAFEAWADSPERTFAEKAFFNRTRWWRRDDPVLAAGAESLGLTHEQVDDLFRLAVTL